MTLASAHAGAGCIRAPSDCGRSGSPTARTGLNTRSGRSRVRRTRFDSSQSRRAGCGGRGGHEPVGKPDRYLAISDTAERRAARSEDLVAEIADALAAAGVYRARIELQPTQRVVDFNWAARQAGRHLGMRIDVDMTITKSLNEVALMRVTPPRPLDWGPVLSAEGEQDEDTPLAPAVERPRSCRIARYSTPAQNDALRGQRALFRAASLGRCPRTPSRQTGSAR